MRTRLIVFTVILAAAAVATWLISEQNFQAAVIFAIASLFVSVATLFRSGPPRGEPMKKAAGGDPRHAIAMRQARGLTRAEEGEIRGAPGGPV